MTQTILQNSPKAGYEAHRVGIDAAIRRVLDSGWYILGEEVRAFEREFAAYVGTSHGVGVASGTDALQLALRACGVGAGDKVLTVSHTAVATVTAITLCGAVPVFVDIDPASFTLDPNRLEDTIHSLRRDGQAPPKAVIPVHLYGHPADMSAICGVAEQYGMCVIEDCAQSHGARWQGRMTGTWGHLAAFSFYPTKNLGALGDGGMIVTQDEILAERVRLLREYGWKKRYVSAIPGDNSRLDEIQAAILRAKLPTLEADNSRRQAIARRYDSGLTGSGLRLPQIALGADHAYHQYVIQTPTRDDLRDYLQRHAIATLIHYPVPVHQQPAYAWCDGQAGLPQTEAAAGSVLSLPLYPELPESQVDAVIQAVLSWAAS